MGGPVQTTTPGTTCNLLRKGSPSLNMIYPCSMSIVTEWMQLCSDQLPSMITNFFLNTLCILCLMKNCFKNRFTRLEGGHVTIEQPTSTIIRHSSLADPRRRAPWMRTAPSPISFIFMQFSAKILPNNRALPQTQGQKLSLRNSGSAIARTRKHLKIQFYSYAFNCNSEFKSKQNQM